MSSTDNSPENSPAGNIRQDPLLQRLMRTGIPLAIISIASLWIGRSFSIPGLGGVFIVTMAVTLLIGFAYNARFVMLLIKRRRQQP